MSKVEFRVWWIPQIPMKPFFYSVSSIEAGKMLCDALAKYDMFQFENKVKPDYSNAGGMSWRFAEDDSEDAWNAFNPDDEFDIECVMEEIAEERAE